MLVAGAVLGGGRHRPPGRERGAGTLEAYRLAVERADFVERTSSRPGRRPRLRHEGGSGTTDVARRRARVAADLIVNALLYRLVHRGLRSPS
jgi:hypothetical protein